MLKPFSSKDELYIYYYIKIYFPDSVQRCILEIESKKYEADIFIPSIKVAIEFDGQYWHKDKYDFDCEKTLAFNKVGIFVIRIRDIGLKPLPSYYGVELWHKSRKSAEGLHTNEYITQIINCLSQFCDEIKAAILSSFVLSYEQFKLDLPTINSYIYDTPVDNSVAGKPVMIYWDLEKNGPLKPENIPYGTDIRAFFKCPAGKTIHENVSLACQHDHPSINLGKYLCILFGHFTMCKERCDVYYEQAKKCVDIITQIKDELDFYDYNWLRSVAFNDEKIIAHILKKYLCGSISTDSFERCFLDDSHNYFLTNRRLPISSPELLMLVKEAQSIGAFFEVIFDATQFDVDNYSRECFYDYLISALANINANVRRIYLSELLYGFTTIEYISQEMKGIIRSVMQYYSIKTISSKIDAVFI